MSTTAEENSLNEWLKHAPPPHRLREGKRWHVFLSYRSVNRAWVIQLYDVLKELGHEVFLDQYVLSAADRLVRSLEEGLQQSSAGVLVWVHRREGLGVVSS